MKFVRKAVRVYPLLGLLALISVLAGCTRQVPSDADQAVVKRSPVRTSAIASGLL